MLPGGFAVVEQGADRQDDGGPEQPQIDRRADPVKILIEKRAEQRITNSFRLQMEQTVKHKQVRVKEERIHIGEKKTEYALFPVWLLRTQYRNRTYTFAMNGQTGAFIGEVPISKKKLGWLFGGVSAAVSAGVFVAGLLIGLF